MDFRLVIKIVPNSGSSSLTFKHIVNTKHQSLMKTITNSSFFWGLFLLANANYSYSQITDVEQVSLFSTRKISPIVLDVKSDTSYIYFNAKNNSFYPYVLEIKFDEFRNLSPRVFDKKTVLLPGLNRLFTFKIIDKTEAPALSYQIKYYLSNTTSTEKRFSPYLIPIGKNKVVEFLQIKQEESPKTFIDQFVMSTGDTVFCARKGVVTALPDNQDEVDRIIGNSVEIRHDDGTIAVYLGLNPETKMVFLGQKVFPGQPVGRIGNSKILTFKVFEIQNEGKVASFDIFYPGPDNKLLSPYNIRGLKSIFPEEVIIKEMTKKEISKYRKNSLF